MSPQSHAQKSVQGPVVVPVNIIAQRVLPCATGTDSPSEDLQMGESLTHFHGSQCSYQATINKLPDDALLDIFDSYLNDNDQEDDALLVILYSYLNDNDQDGFKNVDEWHTLVHVCRRWRNVVFASPRRLNLRLLITRCRPVREMLDIWPALPIVIGNYWIRRRDLSPDNRIAALDHPDRVCSIDFNNLRPRVLKALSAEMRVPFPELTYLRLWSNESFMPVIPNSFLRGSAPRLRTLKLRNISFPALLNLLLSASDLVDLSLQGIPLPGYISPEAMAACLSSLNRLQTLSLGFQSPRSLPDQYSSPQTRIVLPALTDLHFSDMISYSEDFLSRIDTTVLKKLSTLFFLDLVSPVPHLTQFIGRTTGFKPYKVARVALTTGFVWLSLTKPLPLSFGMMCHGTEVHVMSVVCGRLSPFLSFVERLDLTAEYWPSNPHGEDDAVSSQFLELFQSFTAIRSLHVSEGLIPFIALALQQLIEERATEVLPNLRDLFMEGSEIPRTVQEAMQPFLTARRLSGRRVVVHHWEGSTTVQ